MTSSSSPIGVQDIDHCGIVAGIIDSMCLAERINQLLGTHPQEIVSSSQVVKAMILDNVGLVSAPLYLFEKFFAGKAIEHLLGEEISPEHLNDDRQGNRNPLSSLLLKKILQNFERSCTVRLSGSYSAQILLFLSSVTLGKFDEFALLEPTKKGLTPL